jgi:hypothetical protein
MADKTTAKEVGKKARKVESSDAQTQAGSAGWQGGYGINYFPSDDPSVQHAQEQSIKAKALADIRQIYNLSGEKITRHTYSYRSDVAAYKALQDLEYLRDFDNMVGKSYLEDV